MVAPRVRLVMGLKRTALKITAPLHMCHRHLMFLSLTFTSTRLAGIKVEPSHCLTAQGRTEVMSQDDLQTLKVEKR